MSEVDAIENALSVRDGFRILLSYTVGGEQVIITKADRSVTTILSPKEY